VEQREIERALVVAAEAIRAGRYDEAVQTYQDLLQQSAEHPVALNGLGLAALAEENLIDAIGYFRRAQSADPHSPALGLNLAKAYRLLGDQAEERTALETVLAIDRRHLMALVRLAELLERQGETAAAADHWRGVLVAGKAVEQRTPAIQSLLDHAQAFVSMAQADFAYQIDKQMAEARAALSPAAHHRFDACVDHTLGRRLIYANECAGLHFPFLPADEFFDRDHFSWLGELEAHTDAIRSELETLLALGAPGFVPYIAQPSGTPHNKWTTLDHSANWGALHLWNNGERNEAARGQCPQTVAAIEALPLFEIAGHAPTVFFSLLQPSTHLPAHTGVSNIRSIVHLPLVVPAGCRFRVGGETRAWTVGEAWVFDDTIEHEAWNESDTVRGILIFDVWNPYLTAAERDLLSRYFPAADSATHGKSTRFSN